MLDYLRSEICLLEAARGDGCDERVVGSSRPTSHDECDFEDRCVLAGAAAFSFDGGQVVQEQQKAKKAKPAAAAGRRTRGSARPGATPMPGGVAHASAVPSPPHHVPLT